MNEKWKPISGYEGLYEISNYGNVRSLDCYRTNKLGHVRFVKGKPISGYIDQDGYRRVLLYPLSDNWKNRKKYFVHQLVLENFVGPRTGKISRHLDGNPSNNFYKNLKWGTTKENCLDRKRHGTSNKPEKGHNHFQACLTEKQASFIKAQKGKVTQAALAEKFGVSRVTIYRIWSGKRYD